MPQFTERTPCSPIDYTCADCGAPARLVNGVAQRDCAHDEAAITAHLSAVMYGQSRTMREDSAHGVR